jgi:oxalate decarboxylase/phosphoglucose isomerase-like protein (cupin superfamily)
MFDFFQSFRSREDLQNGRLMGALDISEGSSHWEMHPDGDEILYLLSGSMDVELEDRNEKRCIRLSGMTGCVVPCGIWHRTVVHQPGKMIFITPGKGTQHR